MTNTDSISQINAIHSMLESGHQSVELERHSLALWGLTIALLVGLIEWTYSQPFPLMTDFFKFLYYLPILGGSWPELTKSSLRLYSMSHVIFVGCILITVVWLDNRLTYKARQRSDRSVSYIQQRLYYVYWMIIVLYLLFVTGVISFGGNRMIYGMFMALFGLLLFCHGLFSKQLLGWAGVMLIVFGIINTLLFSRDEQTALTIAVFGLGLPLLGWTIHQKQLNRSVWTRIGSVLVWACVIFLSSWLLNSAIYRFQFIEAIQAPNVSYQDYRSDIDLEKSYVVSIPIGTNVPMYLELETPLATTPVFSYTELGLAKPVHVFVMDGQPTPIVRIGNQPWQNLQRTNYEIQSYRLWPTLSKAIGAQGDVRIWLDF